MTRTQFAMYKALIITILAVWISACGWQLRGGAQQNSNAENSFTRPSELRLIFMDRKSKLAQPLKEEMVRLKVNLSGDASTALVIEKEQIDKRPLAFTETGVTAQYQLMYSVEYHYQNKKGEPLNPTRKAVSWRSYDFDAQLIVAKTQEEQSLLREMRIELAQRILDTSF